MALTDISQSPLGAFYQSPLLVRNSGKIVPTTFVKITSLRKWGYNCTLLDKTFATYLTGEFAVPIKWSPNYPLNDIFLNDKISLDVKWMATINETTARITSVTPVYKMPYQIEDKDAWDAGSYCILDTKIYNYWYEVHTKSYNGNEYNDLLWTDKIYSIVHGLATRTIYKNLFEAEDTNWYYNYDTIFNVWSSHAKASPISTPSDIDKSIIVTTDLGIPYAKITSTLWIFNFLLIDGFYLYDPSNLVTLDYTSQTFVGHNGSTKWYLKYYTNVTITTVTYTGWILCEYNTLPHAPDSDWLYKYFYICTNENTSCVGNYTKYRVMSDTHYIVSTVTLADMPTTKDAYLIGLDTWE